MKTTIPLSRDAEFIAACLFGMGRAASISYSKNRVIGPRTIAALAELEQRGMIIPKAANLMPPDYVGWQATESIGIPIRDFPAPTDEEGFMIFEPMQDDA